MADITLTLSQDDLEEAVRLWLKAHGYIATERMSVRVTHIPGDRPFDSDTTTASVSGIIPARDRRMNNAQFAR